eukprot:5544559-Prymnesium_polylepis.1
MTISSSAARTEAGLEAALAPFSLGVTSCFAIVDSGSRTVRLSRALDGVRSEAHLARMLASSRRRPPPAISGAHGRWAGGVGGMFGVRGARLLASAGEVGNRVPRAHRWEPAGKGTAAEHGAFCGGAQMFDAVYFGMSAAEASSTDPQQRLLLEVGYTAAHAAGHRLSGATNGAN